MTHNGDYFDDPSDFNKEPFRNIDNDIRCPICKEIYNIPMILTTCSHSFCTLCIRRCLIEEQICPKCRRPAFDNNLIHNYALEDIAKLWKQQRMNILSIEKNMKQSVLEESVDDPIPDTYVPYPTAKDKDTDFIPPHTIHASQQTEIRKSSRNRSSTRTHASSSSTLSPEAPSETKEAPPETKIDVSTIVECPICEQHMKYAVLEQHLDQCMRGNSAIPSSTPSSSSGSHHHKKHEIKKPHKLVYSMLTDKALQNKLKELNIPHEGDRSLNIWRHKEYLTLYNSNNDSTSPVSNKQLMQKLADNEKTFIRNKQTQGKKKMTDTNEHKRKYNDEFNKLIDEARKKKENPQNHE